MQSCDGTGTGAGKRTETRNRNRNRNQIPVENRHRIHIQIQAQDFGWHIRTDGWGHDSSRATKKNPADRGQAILRAIQTTIHPIRLHAWSEYDAMCCYCGKPLWRVSSSAKMRPQAADFRQTFGKPAPVETSARVSAATNWCWRR